MAPSPTTMDPQAAYFGCGLAPLLSSVRAQHETHARAHSFHASLEVRTNYAENVVNVFGYGTSAHPHHAHPIPIDELRRAPDMHFTVGLDNQLASSCIEIDNKRVKHMLPSKFDTKDATTQSLPKNAL